MNHLKKETINNKQQDTNYVRFCACGCGEILNTKRKKYLHRHKKISKTCLCRCGCGKRVKTHGSIYCAGHQSKYGNSGMCGKTHTKEVRKILSEKCGHKGKNHPMYGKHHSKETRRKISIATENAGEKNPFYGKHHSDETKRIMSLLKLKGTNDGYSDEFHDEEYKIWIKKDRDKGICQNCFIKKNKLHIHHIDENKKDSSPYNLISLCIVCHLIKYHKNKNLIYKKKLRKLWKQIAIKNTKENFNHVT